MHRLVWDLRLPRPPALDYEYSIAAVWQRGTPLDPRGPLVLPGNYTVTLSVDGAEQTRPLEVRLDPRVHVDADALRRQLDLAIDVGAVLGRAVTAHREIAELLDQRRDALPPQTAAELTTIADDGKPSLAGVADVLAHLATAVEGADAAPTQGQTAVLADYRAQVDDLVARWRRIAAGLPPGPAADASAKP